MPEGSTKGALGKVAIMGGKDSVRFLDACINAALAGGKSVRGYSAQMVEVKSDLELEHHAIVSSADFRSQAAILEVLSRFDLNVRCMVEEACPISGRRGNTLRLCNSEQMAEESLFIIDELDGSSSYAAGHYEWSVSIGYVDHLTHMAAAVYAPAVWNGVLFAASKNGGAYAQDAEMRRTKLEVAPATLRDAYVLVGPDTFLSRFLLFNRFALHLANECRTLSVSGSCALALGLVAAGRANALIQPPQSPWDWAAGKLLVEEAGGVVLFYEYRDGKVCFVDALEARHYDPSVRAVGLIAGDPILSHELLSILQIMNSDSFAPVQPVETQA